MSDRPGWADEIVGGLAGLRAQVAAQGEALTGLRADVLARFEGLRGEVAAQGPALAAMRARFDSELPKLRVDLMERVDRLQDRLSDMFRDVGLNFASADRAIRGVRSQREVFVALEEQVMELTKAVRLIQAELRDLRGRL